MKKGLWLIGLSLCCLAAYAQSGSIDINGTVCPVDTVACYEVGPGTLYTRFDETIGSKGVRFDVYLKDEEGQSFDLELQISDEKNIIIIITDDGCRGYGLWRNYRRVKNA